MTPAARTFAARLGLSVLAGCMAFLACPDFDLWPLMWLAMVPAAHVAVTSTTPRRAFLQGWVTGIVGNAGGFYWMLGLLERFGHLPTIAALPIMLLLVAYQGLTFALWSWLVHRLDRATALPMTLLAPVVMATLELLVPQIFPFYLSISQAWQIPLIQIAELTGPIGITAVMLMTAGALHDLRVRWHTHGPRRAARPALVAVGVVAAVLLYGGIRMHQVDGRRAKAPKVKVGTVQANVGIQEKWDPRMRAQILALHQALSARLQAQGADLIVWPESSYPYPMDHEQVADFPSEDPRRLQRGFSLPTVFGTITHKAGLDSDPGARFPYNTAFMMDAEGRITGAFDKVFLLIFGEYIPFYERIPWFRKIFAAASHFNRGQEPASFPFEHAGQSYRLGPLICYEDILPRFANRVAALSPHLFVNITNDAWFGKTSEPWQHLALAVFRSVEHRIDMIRAVNTGVSVHIDAAGRVLQFTPSVDPYDDPPPAPATLFTEAALMEPTGPYRTIGDTFGVLNALSLCAIGAHALRRRRRRAPG